ncbi:PfkB family carbohydrate kinase [Pseudarthrobacter sp. NPDC058329]|uniref:PfkB family carbohydrate kinase n=1 Tax=Pseudarthrobacter sp. NPDC058329 TaxID=3346448 RepID=UPI0036DA83EB
MPLTLKTDASYDAVALGEIMLRLDPGAGRIRTARQFDVWEGGGEYNAIRALSHVFRQRTAALSALVDNDIGHLIEGLARAGGVDTSLIKWVPYDGLGRSARNGLNFTERGYGIRGARGVSDRGNTAISQMTAGDMELEDLFGVRGVRWFHTGGIFAGLSENSYETAMAVIKSARAYGTVVSVDLNYRPSLWADHGGQERAAKVFTQLAEAADVLIGGETDFLDRLGIEPPADSLQGEARFSSIASRTLARFPNLNLVATTARKVTTASRNDWQGMCHTLATGTVVSRERKDLEILDRVGGGDGFASGLIYGLLQGLTIQEAVEIGAAHGALAMTTPGDNSMATLPEVLAAAQGIGSSTHR